MEKHVSIYLLDFQIKLQESINTRSVHNGISNNNKKNSMPYISWIYYDGKFICIVYNSQDDALGLLP